VHKTTTVYKYVTTWHAYVNEVSSDKWLLWKYEFNMLDNLAEQICI